MSELKKSEFSIWKNSETTKKVFALLMEEKEAIRDLWEIGNLMDPVVNARHVGIVEGINKILFMEVDSDEE